MTDSTSSPRPVPSGFFALRTPLLPFDELLGWSRGLEAVTALGDPGALVDALGRDRARLRERLLAVLSRPALRDAVFLASPAVDEALDDWAKEPDSEAGRRLEPTLVAYFTRAAARATPFGLFAGCTVGAAGGPARFELQALEHYQRHSRLDMDYLWALAERVERDPELRRGLVFRPNSSLYRTAGRLHLAETRLNGTDRSYHLVAVDDSPYLTAVLERAAGGATLDVLAEVLVDDEITIEEAQGFLAELVDSQILVADIRPAVTGREPVHELVAALRRHPATALLGDRLDDARALLEALDAEGPGAVPDRYRAVAAVVGELPAEPTLSRLVQVDLVKPARSASLPDRVLTELARGVQLLHRLAPVPAAGSLSGFRDAFADRYETREVPLVELLDEEMGIGFERSTSPLAEAAPLLAGLPFPSPSPEGEEWTARDGLLLRLLTGAVADGAHEVALADSDVASLPSQERPLPDGFHVMARLAASDEDSVARGAFRVLLDNAGGPSGAGLLGRFCHADTELHARVREHLRNEEAGRPDAVFAEIVHLPEGRVGNILSRPVLRDYEIPYLGRSGAPTDRQLPVTDLLVSVRDGRVVLRSRRLQREVLPRLTTAHNWGWRSLGVYRFLCALQHQGVVAGLAWDWGPLRSAPFLPRVVSGRVVLSRAAWNLRESDLRVLRDVGRGAEGFARVQRWRRERRLPRYVALADGDNELVIDLDNVLSLEALAAQVRGSQSAALVELFPGCDELCVSGPEGRFVHELVVPFGRTSEPPAQAAPSPPRQAAGATAGAAVRRRFPPGSEWLYAKLYSGVGTADRVLEQLVEPVVRTSLTSGAADSWFFIRYSDPEPHLRVRFHGQPTRLHGEVLPELQRAAHPLLDDGLLWRVQLDTYEREVERYGGARGIELSERVFAADSEAVVAVLASLSGDAGLDLRWRLALAGMDLLLDDLGLNLQEKRGLARAGRESFGREFRIDGAFRGKVGQRFRAQRVDLEALLDPHVEVPAALIPGVEVLRARSRAVAPVAAELQHLARSGTLTVSLPELAHSLLHMHVNRLLRSAQRAQELVLYELLDRAYTSQAGRRRESP